MTSGSATFEGSSEGCSGVTSGSGSFEGSSEGCSGVTSGVTVAGCGSSLSVVLFKAVGLPPVVLVSEETGVLLWHAVFLPQGTSSVEALCGSETPLVSAAVSVWSAMVEGVGLGWFSGLSESPTQGSCS